MEKTFTFTVPERFEDNFGDAINKFLKILPELNEDLDEIIVDFEHNKFIVPHYIGPLCCLLKHKKNQGIKISIINESTYLQAIHFQNEFLDLSNLEKHQSISFEYYQGKTYLPIIHFPTSILKQQAEFRENVLTAVNSILKKQLNLPINLLTGIYYMLDELTQNIVDHSAISFGTLFLQFYPEKGYLDLSICDMGKGLFQSYLDSGKHSPKSNAEAINFGVYGKSTKNIPESRGFGLNTTRNMLTKGLKGQFFMMTGNGFFIQSFKKEEIISVNEKFEFKGCMLNLRIPLFKNDDFTINSFTDL
jgi:hypothetical protein